MTCKDSRMSTYISLLVCFTLLLRQGMLGISLELWPESVGVLLGRGRPRRDFSQVDESRISCRGFGSVTEMCPASHVSGRSCARTGYDAVIFWGSSGAPKMSVKASARRCRNSRGISGSQSLDVRARKSRRSWVKEWISVGGDVVDS